MADGGPETTPREPSLLDAVLPVVVLIVLIAGSIVLYGTAATDGPLQVALFLAAAFAALVALKNGYGIEVLREAATSGIATAMEAIFILLAVGALIGTWNMAGTIPTIVSYGIGILSARWFFLAACAICALIGLTTGSSWTTAGTLGVAFIGIAKALGVSPAIAAGAIISGAYFGDKMTPLSETTILVPKLVGGGLTTGRHIRAMAWTSGPSFVIALIVFGVIGWVSKATGAVDVQAAQSLLANHFDIALITLLPLVVLIVATLLKLPPFLSLLGSALFAGVLSHFTQPAAVAKFVAMPELGSIATTIAAIYKAMATGFVLESGNATIDALFSRGGMTSMLTTVWLILGALSFAAIMEAAGFLGRLIAPVVARASSNGRLILSVVLTAFGLNLIAGDQYVADVMTARAYPAEFEKRGLAPWVCSRAVEDSGTVTSPLIPWNSCGAYMAGVLGVPTGAYLPYCFFNIASPLIEVFMVGLFGVGQDRLEPAEAAEPPAMGGGIGLGAAQAEGRLDMIDSDQTRE